jgi:oligopeptide/dipeptide ABC transporter ATP-binding protein
LSGGQKQRVGIARALALDPDFLICDEPVSALDVSVQAQIINLLQDLQKKFRFSYLFISHDLSVVYHISDRVLVMYLGRIVETATYREIYREPLHPYTQILMSSNPVLDPQGIKNKSSAIGEVNQRSKPTVGCSFSDRCPMAIAICKTKEPTLKKKRPHHSVACHLYST